MRPPIMPAGRWVFWYAWRDEVRAYRPSVVPAAEPILREVPVPWRAACATSWGLMMRTGWNPYGLGPASVLRACSWWPSRAWLVPKWLLEPPDAGVRRERVTYVGPWDIGGVTMPSRPPAGVERAELRAAWWEVARGADAEPPTAGCMGVARGCASVRLSSGGVAAA